MNWRSILMLIACIVIVPFLLLTIYQNVRHGGWFGAGLMFVALGLIVNIGLGIISGDITFD